LILTRHNIQPAEFFAWPIARRQVILAQIDTMMREDMEAFERRKANEAFLQQQIAEAREEAENGSHGAPIVNRLVYAQLTGMQSSITDGNPGYLPLHHV
jgi:hypothetical protein